MRAEVEELRRTDAEIDRLLEGAEMQGHRDGQDADPLAYVSAADLCDVDPHATLLALPACDSLLR